MRKPSMITRAKAQGASHQDTISPHIFYKVEDNKAYSGKFSRGTWSGWRRFWHFNLQPEWARSIERFN